MVVLLPETELTQRVEQVFKHLISVMSVCCDRSPPEIQEREKKLLLERKTLDRFDFMKIHVPGVPHHTLPQDLQIQEDTYWGSYGV